MYQVRDTGAPNPSGIRSKSPGSTLGAQIHDGPKAWHASAVTIDDAIRTAVIRRTLPDPATRRFLRERGGLSQEEMAEALGVTRTAVTRWEQGTRTPRRGSLDAYAELLERLRREVLA